MNAPFPPRGRQAPAGATRGALGQGTISATSVKWAALQEAGSAAAILAGLPPEHTSSAIRNFPVIVRGTDPRLRTLIEHGIDDLAAIMESALAALLAVRARGIEGSAPALTLWREFQAARDALLALAPAGGAFGPRRSA